MSGVATVMGAKGISVEENSAFVALSRAFRASGVAAPQVLAVSDDGLCYLQDDLGDATLYASLAAARERGCFESAEIELLCKVVAALPRIQFETPKHFDLSLCYPTADFNERTIMWDLNYFKYCFLKGVGIEFNENRLEDEFVEMTARLLSDNDNVFLYRDFQSRNVML
jgi:aminoglycoside/choline kinase family phosphotransferase